MVAFLSQLVQTGWERAQEECFLFTLVSSLAVTIPQGRCRTPAACRCRGGCPVNMGSQWLSTGHSYPVHYDHPAVEEPAVLARRHRHVIEEAEAHGKSSLGVMARRTD